MARTSWLPRALKSQRKVQTRRSTWAGAKNRLSPSGPFRTPKYRGLPHPNYGTESSLRKRCWISKVGTATWAGLRKGLILQLVWSCLVREARLSKEADWREVREKWIKIAVLPRVATQRANQVPKDLSRRMNRLCTIFRVKMLNRDN